MIERLLEFVGTAPWYRHIGMKPRLVGDRIVVELDVKKSVHFQALGMTHGGVIASVLDSAIGLNVNKNLFPEGKAAVTAQLNINYLKPVYEGKIYGEGKVISMGSNIAVGYGEVKNENGEVVASGTATFYITIRSD
jgi:uncharacterized protein (TIGR00369 family)